MLLMLFLAPGETDLGECSPGQIQEEEAHNHEEQECQE